MVWWSRQGALFCVAVAWLGLSAARAAPAERSVRPCPTIEQWRGALGEVALPSGWRVALAGLPDAARVRLLDPKQRVVVERRFAGSDCQARAQAAAIVVENQFLPLIYRVTRRRAIAWELSVAGGLVGLPAAPLIETVFAARLAEHWLLAVHLAIAPRQTLYGVRERVDLLRWQSALSAGYRWSAGRWSLETTLLAGLEWRRVHGRELIDADVRWLARPMLRPTTGLLLRLGPRFLLNLALGANIFPLIDRYRTVDGQPIVETPYAEFVALFGGIYSFGPSSGDLQ
ncbi:MAG: hypothetical protein H6707_17370 [Deltaproteobacteria bacterium]|nr:hypothetical protein [Deltaproteobacteria bacterium]